jgi:hypothetical protein
MKKEEMHMDLRMHDEGLENAKLALINQGAVVAAIASLAEAIRGTQGGSTSTTSPPPTSNSLDDTVDAPR